MNQNNEFSTTSKEKAPTSKRRKAPRAVASRYLSASASFCDMKPPLAKSTLPKERGRNRRTFTANESVREISNTLQVDSSNSSMPNISSNSNTFSGNLSSQNSQSSLHSEMSNCASSVHSADRLQQLQDEFIQWKYLNHVEQQLYQKSSIERKKQLEYMLCIAEEQERKNAALREKLKEQNKRIKEQHVLEGLSHPLSCVLDFGEQMSPLVAKLIESNHEALDRLPSIGIDASSASRLQAQLLETKTRLEQLLENLPESQMTAQLSSHLDEIEETLDGNLSQLATAKLSVSEMKDSALADLSLRVAI